MTTALATIGGDATGRPAAAGGPANAPVRALNRRQKAAIIVRLLLAEGVKLPLADLPEALQGELAQQMATMRFVDRATLRAVVNEFVSEIEDIGLSFPAGLDGALSVLDGTIGAATAARIRKARGIQFTGDPWDIIAGLDPDLLIPVLETESTEVAAVLLSKLKVATAASLLGRLPGPRARRVAYAVSLTGAISPEVVERIGHALVAELDSRPPCAFASGPVERVGAILNFSPAATRDEVLTGLDEDDRAFAEEVRRAIFTFANIPARIDPRDMPKIARDTDQAALITALAGATGELADTADFILGALSKRMADQLRDEIETLGQVKPKDAETAMNAVIATIRALEAAGEILLITAEED